MTEQELNQNPDEQNESSNQNAENTAPPQDANAGAQEDNAHAVNPQEQMPEPVQEPSAETGAQKQNIDNDQETGAQSDETASTEETAQQGETKSKRKAAQEARANAFNEVFAELQQAKENKTPIEVELRARIKGGLRAFYKGMPLFLPASHFSLKRAPREEELTEAVGTKQMVHVHEVQQDEQGRKTAIVSRRALASGDFWERINVGDIIEGRVSSVASFGVFVDMGGVEGLIHVSRLSHQRVENPADIVKKGDTIRAVVVEVNPEKKRIGLSRRELEESPWTNAANDYPAGTTVKGIVKRLTNFGAYVEVRPGVEGLLRTSELSWAQRVSQASDVLTEGQEIEAYVLSVSEEQRTLALSLKKLQENPWPGIAERIPQGTEITGTIKHVAPQGAIVTVAEDVDGFLPRSKQFAQGNKAPFKKGDQIQVIVADVVPNDESLILTMVAPEGAQQQDFTQDAGSGERRERRQGSASNDRREGGDRRQGGGERRDRKPKDGPREQRDPVRITLQQPNSESTSVSFLDLLSEEDRAALMGNSSENE
ncbi:MAG TPA: S1 RNA-binding domain-containing protein [Patescibacteria group bacterium]|nr:S1 RNA-binding domain-containing protein [Patescibacteria group bacterium]